MTPDLPPPLCSGCQASAVLARRLTRFHHGTRVLPFEGWIWRCPSLYADPEDGSVPYPFSTIELTAREEAQAALAWENRLPAPMPSPQPCHLPDAQRSVRLSVLLAPQEPRPDPTPALTPATTPPHPSAPRPPRAPPRSPGRRRRGRA